MVDAGAQRRAGAEKTAGKEVLFPGAADQSQGVILLCLFTAPGKDPLIAGQLQFSQKPFEQKPDQEG